MNDLKVIPFISTLIYYFCKKKNTHNNSIFSHRVLRRLNELMDSLELACQVVGDTELQSRFQRSKESIRRGLPFAASLYI
jgi:superfamily II RNA helicase